MVEEKIKKLEVVANQLESGELSLEKSLELFSDGVKMIKECHQNLEKAELKIKEIIKDQGVDEWVEKELEDA